MCLFKKNTLKKKFKRKFWWNYQINYLTEFDAYIDNALRV